MNKEMQSFNKNHAFHLESLGIHYVQNVQISPSLQKFTYLLASPHCLFSPRYPHTFPCWLEKFLLCLINIS